MGDKLRMLLLMFRVVVVAAALWLLKQRGGACEQVRPRRQSHRGRGRALPGRHRRTVVHYWLIIVRVCVQNGIVLGHIMMSMP